MTYFENAYERLVEKTLNFIHEAEEITGVYQTIFEKYYEIDASEVLSTCNTHETDFDAFFSNRRARVKTDLIRIVVTGEFSTGKSFLISGLINKLKWSRIPHDKYPDEYEDKYESLLPDSPRQTTSCPLEIVSTEASLPSLEVTFADDLENPIVLNVDPEAEHPDDEMRQLMLSYVTALEFKEFRRREHRNRRVISAKLRIPDMNIPASIYDLPGLGGINAHEDKEIYQEIFQKAMGTADIIIYLSSCERELGERELDMLRFIEDLTKGKGVPVIGVLTKIDKQSNANIEEVKRGNRQYFRQYFSNIDTDDFFFSEGFLPVSAASEAKAKGHIEEWSETKFQSKLADSGMPKLRNEINKRLTHFSAPIYLRQIVHEIRKPLMLLKNRLENSLEAEREPIENLESRMQKLTEQHHELDKLKNDIIEDLKRRSESALNKAFRDDPVGSLRDKLRTGIHPLIKNLDVLDTEARHHIDRETSRLLREWFEKKNGLADQMADTLKTYHQHTVRRFTSIENDEIRKNLLKGQGGYLSAIDDLFLSLDETKEDDSTTAMSIVSVSSSIAAGVTGIFTGGAATALTIGLPVGAVFTIAAIGLNVLRKRKNVQKRRELRRELKKNLDTMVDETIRIRREELGRAINEYSGQIVAILDESLSENTRKYHTLENRLDQKTLLKDRIQQLEKLQKKSALLLERINAFVNTD